MHFSPFPHLLQLKEGGLQLRHVLQPLQLLGERLDGPWRYAMRLPRGEEAAQGVALAALRPPVAQHRAGRARDAAQQSALERSEELLESIMLQVSYMMQGINSLLYI